jgi:hypothetical protein
LGRVVLVPLGEVVHEHVGGFDDVVVDADEDEIVSIHDGFPSGRGRQAARVGARACLEL